MKQQKIFRAFIGISIIIVALCVQGFSLRENKDLQKCSITVAVLQVADHPALDATREGIFDTLTEAGYVEGVHLKWCNESAQGNTTLAMQIAQKWSGRNYTALVGIGTLAAQALYSASRREDTPVIFATVTDPIESGLIRATANTYSRVRGVSNFVALETQLNLYQEILPSLHKLGVIYNPGETNSAKIVALLKQVCNKRNIEIVEATANKTAEVALAAESLMGKVDAVFVSNDNTALSAFPVITKIGIKNKTPVFVSDTDLVSEGALASVGPNQYAIGQQTGRMLIKIIQGKSLDNEPLIEYPELIQVCINLKTASMLDLKIPENVIQQADKVIKE